MDLTGETSMRDNDVVSIWCPPATDGQQILLKKLPNELLGDIAARVANSNRKRTASSPVGGVFELSLVDHHFRSICVPLLFRSLRLVLPVKEVASAVEHLLKSKRILAAIQYVPPATTRFNFTTVALNLIINSNLDLGDMPYSRDGSTRISRKLATLLPSIPNLTLLTLSTEFSRLAAIDASLVSLPNITALTVQGVTHGDRGWTARVCPNVETLCLRDVRCQQNDFESCSGFMTGLPKLNTLLREFRYDDGNISEYYSDFLESKYLPTHP